MPLSLLETFVLSDGDRSTAGSGHGALTSQSAAAAVLRVEFVEVDDIHKEMPDQQAHDPLFVGPDLLALEPHNRVRHVTTLADPQQRHIVFRKEFLRALHGQLRFMLVLAARQGQQLLRTPEQPFLVDAEVPRDCYPISGGSVPDAEAAHAGTPSR